MSSRGSLTFENVSPPTTNGTQAGRDIWPCNGTVSIVYSNTTYSSILLSLVATMSASTPSLQLAQVLADLTSLQNTVRTMPFRYMTSSDMS